MCDRFCTSRTYLADRSNPFSPPLEKKIKKKKICTPNPPPTRGILDPPPMGAKKKKRGDGPIVRCDMPSRGVSQLARRLRGLEEIRAHRPSFYGRLFRAFYSISACADVLCPRSLSTCACFSRGRSPYFDSPQHPFYGFKHEEPNGCR